MNCRWLAGFQKIMVNGSFSDLAAVHLVSSKVCLRPKADLVHFISCCSAATQLRTFAGYSG